jgi:hypothetical protein
VAANRILGKRVARRNKNLTLVAMGMISLGVLLMRTDALNPLTSFDGPSRSVTANSDRRFPVQRGSLGGTVPGLALVPGIIAFAGGLPVMTDDKMHIGGIGVSGGTADQDETCAQAGIDAVKDALK